MSQREGPIQKYAIEQLNALDRCQALNRVGSPFQRSGDPDVSGCIVGLHFELELKRPGRKPRPLQARRLERWAECGAFVGSASTRVEVDAFIARLLARVSNR